MKLVTISPDAIKINDKSDGSHDQTLNICK